MNPKKHSPQDWLELAKKAGWKAEKMAEFSSCSRRTLLRYFQKTFKKSLRKWLVEQRMWQAKNLLENGLSGKEVALEIGYQNTSAFTRAYKKIIGHCPCKISRVNDSPIAMNRYLSQNGK